MSLTQDAISWSYESTESAILCGGQGRRMGGVDKGQIHYRGAPLIVHTTQVAFKLSHQVSWITSSSRIKDQRSLLFDLDREVSLVRENESKRGVMGAVGTALERATREWTWVFACDLPHLTTAALIPLIEVAQSAPSSIGCVAYCDREGREQPLCALWRSGDSWSKRLDTAPSLRSALRDWGQTISGEDHADLFFNLNTPQELRELELSLDFT